MNQWPVDSHIRVIPSERLVPFQLIELGNFVESFEPIAQTVETMSEPGRDPELTAILRREPLSVIVANRQGTTTQIDGHIVDFTYYHPHQFPLRARYRLMEAPQYSLL